MSELREKQLEGPEIHMCCTILLITHASHVCIKAETNQMEFCPCSALWITLERG